MVQLVAVKLPEPRDELLARSPLRLVAFQVRHSGSAASGELRVGTQLRESLGGETTWRLEPFGMQATFQFAAGVDQQSNAESRVSGWRLTSVDGKSTVSVMPDSVGYETTAYPGWQAFSGVVDVLVRQVAELLHPEAELRLGLRYINRIDSVAVASPAEWKRWIDERFIGLVDHPIGHGLLTAQQQLTFDSGMGAQALIQHGFFPDPATSRQTYVMDFDVYRTDVRAFDAVAVIDATSKLHGIVLQLFQSMITADLYDFLRSGDDSVAT